MNNKKINMLDKMKNSFKLAKEFFNKDNNKIIDKEEIEYTHDKILIRLEEQEIFKFGIPTAEKISVVEEFIKELYILLLEYVIKGEFKDGNIYEILEAINNYRDKFYNENLGVNTKSFSDFSDNIQSLLFDFTRLQDLGSFIDLKRKKDIVALYSVDSNGNNDSDERKLFTQLLLLNHIQIVIGDDLNEEIVTGLISLLQEVSKIKTEKYIKYVTFIKDTIILDLFKISLVSGKNRFEYYEGGKIKYLSIEGRMKDTNYSQYIDVLKFINGKKVNNIKFIESYKKKVLEDDIPSLGIYVLLKNYKDIDKSGENLKKIYSLYRAYTFNNKNTKLCKEYRFKLLLNCIFTGNYYLSYLIEKYTTTGSEKLIIEIEDFYLELLNLSDKIFDENYKNYFTYYKYAFFKNIEYSKKSEDGIVSYKELEGIVDTSSKSILKAKKMFNSMEYHNYFEFDIDDFYVKFSDQDKFYCHNLLSSPFPKERQSNLLELELEKVKENKIDVKYKERFGNISESLEKNKLEAMTIIGIFTGIVVYSIGTIQIFSIIEDIGSAILFAGIFLSGLLVLIGGIFYKGYGNISKDLKYNKGLQLFLVALLILVTSFSGKIFFSQDGSVLNGNKGKSIYEKLDGKIKEGENIKDYIDEKILRYESINNELKSNIKKLKDIK